MLVIFLIALTKITMQKQLKGEKKMYFGSWFQRIRLSLMGRHGKAVQRMWERVAEYLKHGGPGIKAIKASPFISCAYL